MYTMTQMKSAAVILLCTVLILGCSYRSISDSGYRPETGRSSQGSDNPFYKGELSELDVLGINPEEPVSEAQINAAFAASQQLTVPKGSSIMLIQSGAPIPDGAMVESLERYYNVSVFSGVPGSGKAQYSKTLRLAAAKGGFGKIVAYWGIIETAQKGLGTKAVSWVPFVGGAIPDESQEMRIRLKIAVVDVRTGSWDMFSPEPFQDKALSGSYTRESADQGQVATLKNKAYAESVQTLVKRYAR